MKSNDLGLQNLKQKEEKLALRRIGCNIKSLSSTSGQAREVLGSYDRHHHHLSNVCGVVEDFTCFTLPE